MGSLLRTRFVWVCALYTIQVILQSYQCAMRGRQAGQIVLAARRGEYDVCVWHGHAYGRARYFSSYLTQQPSSACLVGGYLAPETSAPEKLPARVGCGAVAHYRTHIDSAQLSCAHFSFRGISVWLRVFDGRFLIHETRKSSDTCVKRKRTPLVD